VHLRNQHTALRTGEYLPFTSNCLQLYPILRVEGDQALIVLTNLGQRKMENCSLTIAESPLEGQYEVEVLFGEGDFDPIQFAADGSLSDWLFLETVEPFEQFILELHEP
jgi:hypothetical protein